MSTEYALEKFGAYQKGLEMFDLVVKDMEVLQKDPKCYRLISQQIASADSICANMEEGFGRLSRTEYIRFLDFARGSARETQGRYRRLTHWLPPEVIEHRVKLCGEIIAILTKTIITLKQTPTVREDGAPYSLDPPTLDP
jgi:four helix bundle protein